MRGDEGFSSLPLAARPASSTALRQAADTVLESARVGDEAGKEDLGSLFTGKSKTSNKSSL